MLAVDSNPPALYLECDCLNRIWTVKAPNQPRGEITIGRSNENILVCKRGGISRKHARILREGDSLFVEDLRSTNGTKVNGVRIQTKTEITVGTRIDIAGELVIRVIAGT
jgi:pSer/pThr/pTyr-binding forkhead associated (FHA) protein